MTDQRDRSFQPLESLEGLTAVRGGRAMNVCLVTAEIVGPSNSSGIGTANSALARQLASEGHRVTILYTQVQGGHPYTGASTWPNWLEQYANQGIQLVHIPHAGGYAEWRTKSWLVMQYLRTGDFDLVYFNEHHGSGYYPIAAKRAGLAPYVGQTYCVVTHGGLEWVLEHDDHYMTRDSDVILTGMERRCVEWADFVISPSAYMLQEYTRYGWQLPAQCYVQPYPLIRKATPPAPRMLEVDELVFFGRLETRKGLWLFCEALERVAERLRGKTVTFMGRLAETAGVSVAAPLMARAARWPFSVRLATWLSTQEALDYLQRPGKLAVMPSIADNSPCVIYECLQRGIPFISTSGHGTEELIAPSHRDAVLVPPAVAPLARKLETVLAQGVQQAAIAFKPEQNQRIWKAWHGWLSQREPARDSAGTGPARRAKAGAQEERLLLNVVIDTGACPIATLISNLRAQARYLGRAAGHLVLSSRGGKAQAQISGLLQEVFAASEVSTLVLGIENVDEAREIILDADIAFFSPADYHVDLAFFLRATALLSAGDTGAVSCLVARTSADGRTLEIPAEELPCGDLPAVSAVQAPLVSPVWAVSVSALKAAIETLPLHDETLSQWIPAKALGQRLIQRGLLEGLNFLLLPVVAARRAGPERVDQAHWFRDLSGIASDLGFRPLYFPDAAPWFAMSSFGDLVTQENDNLKLAAGPADATCEIFEVYDWDLPMQQRLRMLAMKIGRPTLAAQLAVSAGDRHFLSETLVETLATQDSRSTTLDLLDVLRRGAKPATSAPGGAAPRRGGQGATRPLAAAMEGVPQMAYQARGIQGPDAASAAPASGIPALSGFIRAVGEAGSLSPSVLIGRGLTVTRGEEGVVLGNPGGQSRLVFMDVRLDRHDRVILQASAASSATVEWEMTLLDQFTGETVGHRGGHTAPGRDREVSLPLPRMRGVLMLALEIKTKAANALTLRSLRLA